jgi:hypothetical protein
MNCSFQIKRELTHALGIFVTSLKLVAVGDCGVAAKSVTSIRPIEEVNLIAITMNQSVLKEHSAWGSPTPSKSIYSVCFFVLQNNDSDANARMR